MKSSVLKALALAAVGAPASYALSLYDTAPPIGLPESHAVKYSANLSAGYDDNLNSSSTDREGGGFVRFGVGASYADFESVTNLSYNAHIGGTFYDKKANGTEEQLFSDMSFSASMSHSFTPGSTYSLSASVSYKPEPDYANGISASRSQGDCLNWSVSNAYSQAIDARWSWTVNASYSGNIYSNSYYTNDDREYLSTGASLSYKYSPLTSYSLSTSYRFDFRRVGIDSENLYLNASMNSSLSPVSSMSISLGTQTKFIDGLSNVYPNVRLGYNRTLTEGLSMSAYASYDNENVDTYAGSGNYLSNATWRVGVNSTYRLTPIVSFNFGLSLIDANYEKGTNGLGNSDRMTWSATAGMTYMFTQTLSGNISYTYTKQTGNYEYYRNVVSAGLGYSF